jgi:proline racemase
VRSRRAITVVGCHAEGETGDVITGGVLPPPGATMFEKMQAFARDQDGLRRLLLSEPRGSICRHLNLIVPPTRPDCDAGVIIMEPTEYVPMSGSNLICSITVLLETGLLPMTEPRTVVTMDTPAGPVRAEAECRDGRCERVRFTNVPCFAHTLDAVLEVAGFGTVAADIAYGGMFYALVDATKLGFAVTADEARDLAFLGERVRLAARAQLSVAHPENPGIAGISIVQLHRPFAGIGHVTRNTCIVAPGRSDRSPTGTGTCARMAVLHARGQMRVDDTMIHESLIGSRFEGRIEAETTLAGRPAIVPSIAGRAWITGLHTYLVDPTDPWPEGFQLPDMMGVTGRMTQDAQDVSPDGLVS